MIAVEDRYDERYGLLRRGTSIINSTLREFAQVSCIRCFCPEYPFATMLHVSLALRHHNTSTKKGPVPLVLCEFEIMFIRVSTNKVR